MRQPDELIELFEATRKELRELLFGAQPHIAEWGVWHTEAYVRWSCRCATAFGASLAGQRERR